MARGSPRIGLPEINLGLMAGGGGTQRLPRLIGRPAASRLAFLGERLDADAAEAIGLVWAVDEGQALPAARELAARLAEQAPGALRRIKRAISEGLASSIEQGLALERELAIETSGGSEALEGVRAYLEKRSPGWKLRPKTSSG
jgi:enoyl-CoA hydratase/carnithine racemase